MILRLLAMKNYGNLRRLFADQSGALKLGSRGVGVIVMLIALGVIVPFIASYTNNWWSFGLFIVLAVIPLFIGIHSFAAFMADDGPKEQENKKDME